MEPTYSSVNYDPSPEKRREYWQTAFGLQTVDGLRPTEYAVALAKKHIENGLTYEQVKTDLEEYYDKNPTLDAEADKVSERIYEILSDGAFDFSVATFKNYHKRLFSAKGINSEVFHPGEFRTVNITKKEPILGGDTVTYQDFGLLEKSLDYDFAEEASVDYLEKSDDDRVARLAEFTARIWQVHPFLEGNTRTTAVFLEKYLRSLGYKVDNAPFEKHARYFRGALVRANYTNLPKNVSADRAFLEKFLRNLIFGAKSPLDIDELYI